MQRRQTSSSCLWFSSRLITLRLNSITPLNFSHLLLRGEHQTTVLGEEAHVPFHVRVRAVKSVVFMS